MELDLDSALEGTGLTPYRVHHAGEPKRGSRPDGEKWHTSGFSLAVSNASWGDLRKQVADACEFLDLHTDTLRILRERTSVGDMRLDFPVTIRIAQEVAAQFEFFPPELVARAGMLRIGIELSLYPAGEQAGDAG